MQTSCIQAQWRNDPNGGSHAEIQESSKAEYELEFQKKVGWTKLQMENGLENLGNTSF